MNDIANKKTQDANGAFVFYLENANELFGSSCIVIH
jgi:hypothetical protein